MAVLAHAVAWRDCVGNEIPWQGKEEEAFDQEWNSALTGTNYSFSSYGYTFLAYNFILDGWVSRPNSLTDCETGEIFHIPILNKLLDECETAASNEDNHRVLKLIPLIRRFNALHMEAIELRIEVDRLSRPVRSDKTNRGMLGFRLTRSPS